MNKEERGKISRGPELVLKEREGVFWRLCTFWRKGASELG